MLPYVSWVILRWLVWLLLLPLRFPFLLYGAARDRYRPATALELKVAGSLPDVSSSRGVFASPQLPFLPLLLALEHARRDPKLRTVLIRIDEPQFGLGKAEELRQGLAALRAAGKEVVVHADSLNLVSYWLSSCASRVVLSPAGALDVAGIASEFTLFKGLLDKAGVRAQLAARGRYKSMREAFAAEQMSDANREMLESLTADLYEQLVERVAEGRGIEPAQVRTALDSGPFRSSVAKGCGLVDELGYYDELRKGIDEHKPSRMLGLRRYLERRSRRWLPTRGPVVALVCVDGSIRTGEDGFGPRGRRATGSRRFVRSLKAIADNPRVEAIVLRVNSPGGSVLASDLMWHAIAQAKKHRPLVVSMVDVAASGGYYVSGVQGARIFANSPTLTGSIGVVGGKIEVAGLYEKLGIQRAVVKQGRFADFHRPASSWSTDELEKLEQEIDAHYDEFVEKMAQARGRTVEQIDAVAQGRVWTGAQAQGHALVDELGGLGAALGEVRGSLGLAVDAPIQLLIADRPGFWRALRARFDVAGHLSEQVHESLPGLLSDTLAFGHERVWARVPFELRWF